jgi:hypothetical protein
MGTRKKPGTPRDLSKAAALMGAKGGSTPTDKARGFRAISRKRNREIALMGVDAQRRKREAEREP